MNLLRFIWPISTTETAMTCHLVMPAGHPGDDFLMEAPGADQIGLMRRPNIS